MKNRRKKSIARKSWARVGGRLVRQNSDNDFAEASDHGVNELNTISSIDSPAVKRRKLARINDVPTSSSVSGQSTVAPRRLTIMDMPEECIVSILSFLEAHEICLVATVCRRLYQVSLNPVLWWNADFHFTLLMEREDWRTPERRSELSLADRRKLFFGFLSQRNAKLTCLSVSFDIDRQIKLLLRLLKECNVKKLSSIDIKWTLTWGCCLLQRCFTKVKNFQSFLQSLGQHCPSLTRLKMQMDISLKSAVALSKIPSIQCLELSFQPYMGPSHRFDEQSRQLSNKAVEQILSLPNLKVLKLRVRQAPATYTLKSNSLEVFEISWSKGFCISGLELPRLNTFKAFNVFCNNAGLDNACLFSIIDQGCPVIQWFNERKASAPGFHNFHLAEDELRSMYLCYCNVHAPWRIFL